LKLGILDQATEGWRAGWVYTETFLRSLLLAGARPEEVEILSKEKNPYPELGISSRVLPDRSIALRWALWAWRGDFDVILPVRDRMADKIQAPMLGWIPDFQHLALPDHFSKKELLQRDRIFENLLRQCRRVLVSSQAVEKEGAVHFSGHRHKFAVASFASGLWAREMPSAPGETLAKFCIPGPFYLVVNQFWSHKNHVLVVEALGLIRARGETPPCVVLAGTPADFRDPENKGVGNLFRQIAALGLHDHIRYVGAPNAEELLDLLRSCRAVIQPSLHEGWSTTLEDAKALGKPALCSDLPVHREQMGSQAHYFQPQDAKELAKLLLRGPWPEAPAWSAEAERLGLARAKEQARAFGSKILELCRTMKG
jgi:glycosyltransferase involved in cell wall biosynthesis